MSDVLCSTLSLQAGEPLFGSAKQISVWFLLEFDGRWEPEAFKNSLLPAPVRTYLQLALNTIPHAQVMLIRQQPRLAPPGNTLFVALPRETDPALYEFHLAEGDDLPALDLPALLAGEESYAAHLRTEPLFLVCTHGRRDRCCARLGLPVYEQMAQQAGAAVWQTSHIGGHRFAANVIALPHGIIFGRVRPDSAAALVEAYPAGALLPQYYRGRVCYAKVAQAAEYYLRAETGITGLNVLRLDSVEPASSQEWIVRFLSVDGGTVYTLHLLEDQMRVIASCGDVEPETYTQYRLVSLSTAPP